MEALHSQADAPRCLAREAGTLVGRGQDRAASDLARRVRARTPAGHTTLETDRICACAGWQRPCDVRPLEHNTFMDIRTVLIAEDDPLIRRVTELALKREGYTVHAVADGQAAVDSATASPVDLIVLDGMMPRLDGIEACRLLKHDPRTAHIPVILLSARSQNGDEQAAIAAGADGYIRKPFDALALGQTLRALCDKIPA